MKTRLSLLLLFLSAALATTAAYGQATYIWTNATPSDLSASTNWNPNGDPSPTDASIGDTMQFDGQTAGPVLATSNTGNQTGFSGTGAWGLHVYCDSNQVNGVEFYTTVANTFPSGLRYGSITIDAGAGPFILGNTTTTNALYMVIGNNFGGQNIPMVNNSTNPAVINTAVRWGVGGGNTHTYIFDGSGNWNITNTLQSANGVGMLITKQGAGTMNWTTGGNSYTAGSGGISTPLTINAGALVLNSAGLLANQAIANNGTLLEYNAAGGSQTLGGIISGSGLLQVNNGTLTLQGASTYSGNTLLTGGELIANKAENAGSSGPLGEGGIITFNGGTLGFSVNNTFDYSSRFDTSTNQAYSLDTAGQNVTLATALTSTNGTLAKLGSGTLTLSGANTYNGGTAVGAGKLVIQGSAGSGGISLANSTSLGVYEGGSQVTPAALAIGTSSGATLEFNSVSSTTTAPIAAGAISAGGTVTVNVNSGSFLINHSYPLLSWTSGTTPAFTLGTLTGAGGNVSVTGKTLYLNVTSLAYIWTGLNNGNWDITTTGNWKVNGVSEVFANGGTALFDDTATGMTNVMLDSIVAPSATTVNDSSNAYSIASSSSDYINGSGSLTKSGNGSLTLSGGYNTFTGTTTINGGLVTVSTLANGGTASDIGEAPNGAANLVFNGGTLQYTGGGAASDHLFTLGTAGGAIDDEGGTLTLNNTGNIALSGTGARTLTLTGSDTSGDMLAAVLGDNGGATAVTKTGAGTWILTGNNTNSGLVTIAAGTLQIGGGAGGSLGTGSVVDDGSLVFDTASNLTVGTITGTGGSVTQNGSGTVVLAGNNTYNGGTTINSGALQVGNGGAAGSLYVQGAVTDNGTLVFNSTSAITIRGFGANITGTGNIIDHGSGPVLACGLNTYSGWLEIDPGATFQPCIGAEGQLLCSVITNNGTLLMERQDGNPAVYGYTNDIVGAGKYLQDNNNQNEGWVVLAGTNSYTGGTFIGGGDLLLGDSMTPGGGSIVGGVWFTNTASAYKNPRALKFNRPDNFTFTNNIISVVNDGSPAANSGFIEEMGPGSVTLTGNNSYPGGTAIDSGMQLQVGNGGANGALGSGAVTNAGTLVFDRPDSVTFGGVIMDGVNLGTVIQFGAGILTLTATNTYSGPTIVSNGTLVVNGSVNGDMDVDGGGLVVAGAGQVGTLTVGGSLNLNAGTLAATLNKSLSVSNTFYSVNGGINYNSGTLVVANAGPALAAGDTFTIFNQPVNGLTVVPPSGVTFTNNLAVDGSITVLSAPSVNTNPTNITAKVTGNVLSLTWPADHLGWRLVAQTNSLSTGLNPAGSWTTVGGSTTVTSESITINPANGSVFYRLVYP